MKCSEVTCVGVGKGKIQWASAFFNKSYFWDTLMNVSFKSAHQVFHSYIFPPVLGRSWEQKVRRTQPEIPHTSDLWQMPGTISFEGWTTKT